MIWTLVADKILDSYDKVKSFRKKSGPSPTSLVSEGIGLEVVLIPFLAAIIALRRLFSGPSDRENYKRKDVDIKDISSKVGTLPIPPEELEDVEVVTEDNERNLYQKVLGRDNIYLTGTYGEARDGGKRKHRGVDIRAAYGEKLYAPFDGKVLRTNPGTSGAGGRSITLIDKEGKIAVYLCHLSKVLVIPNQLVTEGMYIGNTGASGKGKEHCYAPHLHLQVGYYDSSTGYVNYINPETFVKSKNPPKKDITFNKANRPKRSKSFKYDVYNSMLLFMRELGLNSTQASGILGNLLRESQLNPRAYNPSGGNMGAQGIAQWRGPRILKYEELFKKRPKDDPNLNNQIIFVIYEFKNSYQKCWRILRTIKTVNEAADTVLGYYEFSVGVEKAVKALGSHGPRARALGITYAHEALNIYNEIKSESNSSHIFSSSRVNSAYNFNSSANREQ